MARAFAQRLLVFLALTSVTTPTAHAPLRHGSGYSAEALGRGTGEFDRFF